MAVPTIPNTPQIPGGTPQIPTTLPSSLPQGLPGSFGTGSTNIAGSNESIVSGSSIRTIVDSNTDAFRYGLFKYDDSAFEDPTYLGFTIEIDDSPNSALFNWVKPFLEKHSANRKEHNGRLPIYDEFKNKIVQIFKSQESISDPTTDKAIYIKSHYINSVSGLDNLSKKFIEWKKDFLEIELYEDISMFSTYIANLYNNLVYSYETGRVIIPENLVKFNLFIKISEIRNLTSLAKLNSTDANDIEIANALKNNVTCLIYKLTDCEFDFTNAKPFADSITQSGIGASNVSNSVVPIKIYFKSVSRHTFNPLIKNARSMKDDQLDLGSIIVGYTGDKKTNGQPTDNSSTTLNSDGSNYEEGSAEVEPSPVASDIAFTNSSNKKPSSLTTYPSETSRNSGIAEQNDLKGYNEDLTNMLAYNAELAPEPGINGKIGDTTLDENLAGGGFGVSDILKNPNAALTNLGNAAKAKGMSAINQAKQAGLNKLNQLRAELVNEFVYDIQKNIGLTKIVEPDNVYTDPQYKFNKNFAQTALNQAGFDATSFLSSILKG